MSKEELALLEESEKKDKEKSEEKKKADNKKDKKKGAQAWMMKKKWNLNAPQNDTENNRQNEPPRYEHYCMHQNTESDTVKELPEKKKTKT